MKTNRPYVDRRFYSDATIAHSGATVAPELTSQFAQVTHLGVLRGHSLLVAGVSGRDPPAQSRQMLEGACWLELEVRASSIALLVIRTVHLIRSVFVNFAEKTNNCLLATIATCEVPRKRALLFVCYVTVDLGFVRSCPLNNPWKPIAQ